MKKEWRQGSLQKGPISLYDVVCLCSYDLAKIREKHCSDWTLSGEEEMFPACGVERWGRWSSQSLDFESESLDLLIKTCRFWSLTPDIKTWRWSLETSPLNKLPRSILISQSSSNSSSKLLLTAQGLSSRILVLNSSAGGMGRGTNVLWVSVSLFVNQGQWYSYMSQDHWENSVRKCQ